MSDEREMEFSILGAPVMGGSSWWRSILRQTEMEAAEREAWMIAQEDAALERARKEAR